MVDVFPRRAPVALGRYCDLRAAYFFKATCQRARERAVAYHIGFIGFCNKVPCKLFFGRRRPAARSTKNIENNPMQSSQAVTGIGWFWRSRESI
jgi:hypothetical protein